jgi:hypothetical protein
MVLLFVACGSREDGSRPGRGRRLRDSSPSIGLVGTEERESYLKSAANDVSAMIANGASVAEMRSMLSGACPRFIEKFTKPGANGAALAPECKSDGNPALDISSFSVVRRLGTGPDDLSVVFGAMRIRGYETVRFLLEFNFFNLVATDANGKNLAMSAAELGQLDTFLFIVTQGVDLRATDTNGCDALCWAKRGTRSADAGFVAKVEEECQLAARNIPELTRLLVRQSENTRTNRDYELIDRIVAAGANLNAKNADGVAVVVGFVASFDLRVLNLLIAQKDADGNYLLDMTLKVRRKNLRQFAEWAWKTPPSDCSPEEGAQVIALLRDLEKSGRIPAAAL